MPKTFINGIDLQYEIHGSGSPLLLIHGLGMDHSMWDVQISDFSQDHQVISYDLRGHGQSGSPDFPYSIDLLADDLDQFLHFLGLRKASFLGLSLGGRILLRFALKYPKEITAIILADAQSETPPESSRRFSALAEFTRREGIGRAAEEFFSIPALQGLAKRNPQRFVQEKERFLRSSARGFANSCLAIAAMTSLTEDLEAIQVPTLALAGEEDEAYLPYLEIYAEKIRGCRKETIPRAGHLSNLENPGAFNKAVLTFLKGLGKAK